MAKYDSFTSCSCWKWFTERQALKLPSSTWLSFVTTGSYFSFFTCKVKTLPGWRSTSWKCRSVSAQESRSWTSPCSTSPSTTRMRQQLLSWASPAPCTLSLRWKFRGFKEDLSTYLPGAERSWSSIPGWLEDLPDEHPKHVVQLDQDLPQQDDEHLLRDLVRHQDELRVGFVYKCKYTIHLQYKVSEHVGALRGQHFRGEPADDVGPGGAGDGQPTLANSQVPQAWWNGRWPLVLWNILTPLFQMTTGAVLKYLLEGCLNIRVLCYSLYEDQVCVPLLLPYFLFT